ncbi:non-ribosomal peptide synthase/polyketide synthase [Xanthomonas translucens pv. translucens]|uniref:non-ribosomal peptide synthase/polyketide synthase n=1 Tax=Xanthomonas campestris pv. translucens TaxID=343 RepID=UPI0021B7BB9C|nr:non-ribosomal peptide synthase/polyketide synthase [Xanthomonas translucens]MCT8285390.1 non-ribosomal peptide synthase/polyketide synthase [Xanthomonas translucens pv. translucens]MCT8303048.1 non-ribosomal peptide synthase/polyketide synthase [Xanthomonas translucens pv. translucens]
MSSSKLPQDISTLTKEEANRLWALLSKAAPAANAQETIQPRNRDEAPPLSFAQQRLWFLAQLDAQADLAYLMPNGLRLRGRLNRDALRQALDRIVARHETLRTRIGLHQDQPVQIVDAADVCFRLCEHDLSACPDPEAQAQIHAEQETQTPFDLAHDTLARGQLLRLDEDDHVLLVTLHHLVSDGWSMGLLMHELTTLYAAFVLGQPDPLPPLPLQYADIVVWQRGHITGQVLQRQRDFWLEHLRDAPALLDLPSDRPRPALQDYRGDSVDITLDADLTDALRRFSQRHGTTLFMTMLASWAVLLGRLSGQDHVVIGTPVANRTRSELEPLIGLFVNTQALCIDLRANPSIAQVLAQVRATALAAQDHQDLPFEQVIEAVSPERSLAYSPLFQVMLAWQSTPSAEPTLPGLRLSPIDKAVSDAKFDLDLSLHEADDRIVGGLCYATALFDRDTIERHVALFVRMLRGLLADDHVRIAQLPLLRDEDRTQLLQQFNATTMALPAAGCVHNLFEAQARRTPDAVALVAGDSQLRYAELDALADRLAARLVARGIGPERRVAIRLERSPELIIALLAVLKAGGAYVPIDPAYPIERSVYLLEDSQACVLLTTTALEAELRFSEVLRTISVLLMDQPDASAQHGAVLDTLAPAPVAYPQQPAYAIYTSGSSGQPKGVLVEHRQLCNLIHWHIARFGLQPGERCTSLAGLGFDANTWEIWPALCAGATLLLAPAAASADPGALLAWWRQQDMHTSFLPTPLAEIVLREPGLPPTLRVLLTGGDRLGALAQVPGLQLVNNYGPTEATVVATSAQVTRAGTRPSIGQPIANTRAYVLDQQHQLAPINVVGELHIAGRQLARGYLGRPGLTAERFVPDPFADQPGQRMYKTGDLVRWRADASLDFLGRNDAQVKLRGVRIELGEIEAQLRACDGVREAVVLARQDSPGDTRLVAYLVGDATPGDAASCLGADRLRAQLATRLPDAMIPVAYVRLDAFPLTMNGKLDRRALPLPDTDAFDVKAYAVPEGELETMLAALWSDLLGVERIGRHDSFFALGGHSLLGTRLISRIRHTLGLELPLAALFMQPRLAEMAHALTSAAASQLPAIVPLPREDNLPLSFAQQRLWFLAQLDAQADLAYAMPGGVELHGELDLPALQRALDRIVARHQALRTTFVASGDSAIQRIAPPEVGFALDCIDLRHAHDPDADAQRLAKQEAHAPFDLEQGPLIRGRLLRLDEHRHRLLVTMHHIVTDGWSIGLLLRELGALYAAFVQGQPDPLPPLPIQYADYTLWQRRWLDGPVLQRQLDFWRDHLEGAPALLALPTDHPRPALQDYRGDSVDLTLDANLTEALTALSQRHGTTLFMTVLAAWGALLARLSGQDEAVIGTPIANRTCSELEPLIGFFVNTQALRIDLRVNPSVAELLAQVRATAVAAQQHQDLPFEQVIEALNPARRLGHHPVFQAMLVWQNNADVALDLPGLHSRVLEQGNATAKFDLQLTLQLQDAHIAGQLTYASALFERDTIERHLAQFVTLLHSMVADDHACVVQLPLLPDDEHAQLHGFNATATDLDGTGYLHRAIEAQVQRTPDATAVADDRGTLSYADLDARANQLAHHLIGLGVVPESSVAVCLPRSIDLVVALLAILKAGAAYLPLDSDVLPARLDTMLADARPRVLLAHRQSAALLTPRDDRHTVLLDADAALWACASTQAPTVALHPQHPAYVLYTSGSTGTPKGVINTHAGIDNRLQWMQQALQLQPEQRVLQKTPVGFDVSVWELFWPLRVGARLVLSEPGGHKDPAYLIDLIERTGVDTVHFVPSMLRVFLDVLPQGACASLRRIVCSGEALPADLASTVRARLPQARLYNLYGPTEAAVDVSVWECTAADTHSVPIGRPIANTQLHVLDAQRQRSPIGVAGELQIAGVQLARGYLGRPDLTAERFVPDPFAEQPGQRMYRTGDVARWRADGALEYLGRNDHQVKLRGVRIELGEIEAALRGCGVRETVVVVDGADNKRLIAYLVGDGAATDPTALRAQLAARLPEYMVPAAFVHMDALPLTPNGKLDRAALPAPDTDALVANVYAAPEGELETLLATLWRELLDVPQVGRHDNFFALGGHSLLAVKLIERLRRLGWQLEVRALFGTPTVAGLANSLHSASQVVVPPNRIEADCSRITPDLLPLLELTQAEIDTVVANVDGGTANVQDLYPLAPLQEGLLFHHLADPLADPYLQSSLLAFPTSEQRVAFLDALDQVIARHDILRTGVVWQHLRVPVQVVWRQATLPRRVHVFDSPDPATALQHWMHAPEAALRLQQAPLIHAHLADDPATGRWLLGLQHHHLAMDHTTLELLIEEVRAHLAGQQHQLPAPLPFRDFVAHTLAGVSAQEHQAFFTKMLGDIKAPTAPFGVFAPVRNLESLQHLRQELSTTLAHGVRAQARRHGVTAASLFHLAYALLLARSSGRDEVVFGTVLFGRMHASVGVDRVLGMFLNTLPIRLGGCGPTVTQALHHTQQALARLFHHEHAPLALAQRCSAVDPTLPLLNAMLNYRYAGGSNVLGDEAHPQHDVLREVQHIDAQERTHYPLAVSVDDRIADGGFSLDVQCLEQIGSERVAALLLQTVQALVHALEHAPETVLHALELLPAEERARLQRFNTTATDLDGTGYLHRQIEVQAQRTPHAIALVEGHEELSYAALEASANQLAHHLIALGVVPESRVAVCLPRSIDLIVALLAVLKAGAAYLPLDSDVPPARLDTMLADARPRVLLAHRETAALLVQCDDRHSVLLDADAALWACASTQAPTVALHPQHPAYVIYTSGSTGKPKGVINTHAAIDNRLQWMQQELQLQPEQRVLQKTPVGFDVSVWELFWPLRVGARLVLAEPGGHKDPSYLIDLIEQARIDAVHFVPSMLRAFLEALPDGACASLRRIVCSGEALPADLAREARERLPHARLYNLYGPTEAAVDVSVWQCTEADTHSVPIGRPIANTQLHVLDAQRQRSPIGVAGELQIAGVQLARGYLGRPDLTAERFIPDPFAEQPGQRMYRTGDVARWRADGALDYLGRNDDQVKLRGVRIELGEIAAALRGCDGVRDATVMLRQDNTNKPRLVAYVVGDTEVLAADTLRTQLAARLPDTMLPSAYVPLDALPLTPNGKLDRRALPAPDADALATQTYVAPEGEREILLAALWGELLGVEQVGRHDSFFALGGHSLLAVRLISRIRASLGLELPLATLFAHPRLADLAQALDAAAASILPTIVPAERSAPLPLSFAQQRLWFLAQLDAQADLAYLMPNGLRLRGRLDRHALRQALDRIVARHESLRTRIALHQDDPVQIIAPATIGLHVREHDLSGHPQPETELLRLADQETRTPFDLAHDSLVRGQLLRLGEEEHVLLVTLHHLVTDGWSMGVLVQELGTLYAAFAQGRPDPLPPLPIQYADYSLWQRRWLDGPLLQRQLDFWRDHLQDAPALLELPTDRPRPARQDARGDTLPFALDAELSAALTALSQRHGTTVFMTLLAAWGVLLARLSGQEQVVIGTPVANRARSELEPLIGLFVNTQALRIDLRGEPSFADLLGQVRATALAAQAHQDVPFEQVIEALNPARNLAHHPLFQVMFAWHNTPSVALELPDLSLHSVQGPSPTSKFDLELALHERDGAIVGTLGYATALFERSTVQRFLVSFVLLLRAMPSHDHVPVGRLPLLDAPQRQHLLAVFGTGATVAVPAQPVHRLFEAQAQRTPDAIAVVAGQQCVSYAALDARANRLAQRLRALGLRAGAQVAIALPRSIELIVAQLAVLKCAAAYVPLDSAHPRARLLALIADAQAQVLIQEPDGTLAPAGVTCFSLADLDEANTAAPPAITVPPAATAYVIYTSGSTGTPKGVAVSHAAVLAFALSQQHAPLQPQDRVAFLANPAFDASTFEVWATLLHGAAIVVVDQQTLLDPSALARYLSASEVSILHLTAGLLPGYWQAMRTFLPTLRCLLTGGDSVDAGTITAILTQAAPQRLLHCYGPTETTTFSVVHPVATVAADAARIPLGRPLPGSRAYVLDRHGQPVPIGVAGEVHLAGAQLAQGYLHRPDMTAERFVPDPFAAQAGERMYRTGDLARWRDDGLLEFLGRNDDQIKLRGFRIELGEIQAALRACDGIREAVVIARQDSPGAPRLVAYLVGDGDGAAPSPEALRTQLGLRLPDYMVPSAYVQLDALPLTANGKLDRRGLPAPDASALALQTYLAPEGELEILLAGLWSELLGVDQIGRHDSFFALGGHSLLAVRLISRIRSALGVELPLATLFTQPCLADIAIVLRSAVASTLPAIVPVQREGTLSLSFAQQRLWFLSQLDASAAQAYLLAGGVDLHGELDLPALQRALDRIVARHEALRTSFVSIDDGATQIIAPPEIGFALHCIDLRQSADPYADAQRHAEQEASTAFDLEHGPLVRGRLLRLDAHEHRLLLTMHHIVTDGWSMGLLVRELSTLYAAFALGQPDPLPPLPIQYADYAQWQRCWLEGQLLQRQLSFWREHLQGAPALLELPTDRPRPALQDYSGDSIEIAIDAELTAALRALSQRHGSTVFMTVLAAWSVLLSRLSGQDEVVIGAPVANRTRSELEALIGFFVNAQALRIDLRANPSVAELLAQVRRTALAAQDHQDLPFEQVIEALNPERSLAAQPVFQVVLTWQNVPEADLTLPGLRLQSIQAQARDAKFDLELFLGEVGDRIVGSLNYATALFDRGTIERQLAQFVQVLAGMAADAQARIAQLPLLPADERAQLQNFTATETAPLAQATCIHHLFEDQVRRTPDAIALLDGDVQLSYAALEARANQLAHRLHKLGVGPESRVALYLPRGIDQVVALLAVLKAGAAYLPLDPELPSERLAFLLEDSRPRAVLTCTALQDRLPASRAMLRVSVLTLDTDGDAALDDPGAPSVTSLCPDNLAYVIYTSGSTGQPKGTLLTHAGATHYLQWAIDTYRPFTSAVVSSSLAFDATLTSLLAPLLCGARVELLPEHATLDALRQRLCDPTPLGLVKLTPAHLEALGQQLAEHEGPLSPAVMVIGGEALPAATLARWQALAPHTRLINEYGPTETVVGCAVHDTTADDALAPSGRVPIGRPIAHLRIHVLDRHGQLAPIGVAGYLHIAGPQLARGYMGRPDLTAERFVPNPFAEQPGQRMYRSGDLACWRADGTLDFLGRNDEQVKLRGFRIELGEIAAALRACPGVHDAVVLLREDTPGEPHLVAYLLTEQPEQAEPSALRDILATRLPEVMLPTAYVRLDALPLTANGKLDRRGLPAADAGALAVHAYAPPEGELETLLAALWGELLGVERIGRHDSFFALGGHSLLGVRLISRIRSTLGLELPLAALFAQPRLAELAQALGEARATALPPILPMPRTAPMPLSFAQQRLWFLNQLDPRTGATYIMHRGVRLSGSLHVQALTRALDRIVARHETLRTHFASVDDIPVQIIAAPFELALQRIDLSGDPAPESAARLHALSEASTGFDLANGPLVRGRLLRLAEDEHVLLLSMHHIVSDGWSIGVVIEELGALYAAFVGDAPDPLPPLPIQYADYAAWQHRWIDSQLQQKQLDFWRTHLRDAPALLELPTDRPRPPLQDTSGDDVELILDEHLSLRLQALAVQHGVTIFGLLLSAWAALLARYSGQTDLVIGTPSAGRNRSELEPLIGFFVNTLPLRIDLSARPTFLELLDQVQTKLLAAQAHQDLPFERIIEAVRPVRSLAHPPLCQTMFSADTTPAGALDLPELRLSAYPSEHCVAQFDLSLDMQIAPSRIGGVLRYATALFDRSTMQAYLHNYARLLAALADAPTLAVDRQALLDATEWRALQQWNGTLRALQPPTTIHIAFQAQARSTPDAIAVIDGARHLRYAELDAHSDRIAMQLSAAGVRHGDCVVTLLPRSAELVAAQLGILKASAAYVPLDPRQPAARHAQLAGDCQARVIVHAAGEAPPWTAAPCLEIALAGQPTAAFAAPPLPAAAPAYVMYTSGSSGSPKGVLVPHQAVLNLVRDPDYARWQTDDRFAFASNPAFDSSTLEVWAPLLSGGSVVVVPQEVILDPSVLAQFVRTHAISVLILVAGVLRAYAFELARELPTLRYLITGGDIADPQALATLLRDTPPQTLLQTYGPTETTQFVTAVAVTDVPTDGRRIPIGKPIGNLRLYVLDRHRQALPVGMQGELHIAGLGLALGYLRQPALTAEQFVPDPFSGEPGARMYRTGDLGRWRADGLLECLGRRDAQSKIRGFRLEPGEIEAALHTHPQVDQALVRVREDTAGQRRLVAYVIGSQSDDTTAHDPEELRRHLAATLPDYMLPDAYVGLQAWPLTANGKVDVRALPAPDDTQRGIAEADPAQGATECALAQIWCELLGVGTVNRHDNFFAIGGHSLLAVQLATRIQARLGRRLPLSRLFAEPTLARMAAALADSAAASSAPIAALVDRSRYYE